MENNIKKAVTSEAAPAENKPQSEAVLEGTTNPSIQNATTPTQQAAANTVVSTEATAPAAAAVIPEVKQQEVPAQLQETKKELSFGNLFKPYNLGATLKQDPSGKNVISGIVPPKMDYVKAAENKKNTKMNDEDFKKPKK